MINHGDEAKGLVEDLLKIAALSQAPSVMALLRQAIDWELFAKLSDNGPNDKSVLNVMKATCEKAWEAMVVGVMR